MKSKPTETVEYTATGRVGHLVLARPDSLNAFNSELTRDVVTTLRNIANDEVDVLTISGQGRAFSAGYDLRQRSTPNHPFEERDELARLQEITRLIRQLPQPVVAAVHGYTLGAGLELALACDFVVAEEGTVFRFPEVEVGRSITGGATRLLTSTVGLTRAKSLVMLGRQFDARSALAYGIITEVAGPGKLQEVAKAIADELCERPSESLIFAKMALNAGNDGSMAQSMELELAHVTISKRSEAAAKASRKFAARSKVLDKQ